MSPSASYPPAGPPPPPPPQSSPKSPKEGGDAKIGALGPLASALRRVVSPILLESFTLTFLAEWGDRSQIATIGAQRRRGRKNWRPPPPMRLPALVPAVCLWQV
jgi:hypothetical protein